jgi:hypothetical protein
VAKQPDSPPKAEPQPRSEPEPEPPTIEPYRNIFYPEINPFRRFDPDRRV